MSRNSELSIYTWTQAAPCDSCCCGCPIPRLCGPPIWIAARGYCIFGILVGAIEVGVFSWVIADHLRDEQGCSGYWTSANPRPNFAVSWSALGIGAAWIAVFGWGVWVSHAKKLRPAKVLYILFWVLHLAWIVVNFLAMSGYKNECGYPVKSGEPVIVFVCECFVTIYFGYVLWSFKTKIKDETVDYVPQAAVSPVYGGPEAPVEETLPSFFRAPSQRRAPQETPGSSPSPRAPSPPQAHSAF